MEDQQPQQPYTEDASLIGKKLPVGEHNKLRQSDQTIANPLNLKNQSIFYLRQC